MDKDKQIEALQRELWWTELRFKARESYLLRRIDDLEKQLDTSKSCFDDK